MIEAGERNQEIESRSLTSRQATREDIFNAVIAQSPETSWNTL